MRYYRLHDLIACVMEEESLWLKSYEVAPFPEEEANVLCLHLGRSPSDAAVIKRGAFKIRARRIGQRRWECYGPGHDAYLIFQDLLLSQDASFVHGCAVEWEGRGMLFWGRGGVGKTAIALAALKEPRLRLLADDVAIIRGDGRLLSFHKPLALYPYHLPLLGKEAKKYENSLRMATVAAAVRPLWWLGRKVKRWVLATGMSANSWVGRMNPGYFAVLPQELFSPQQLAWHSHAAVAVMLKKEGEQWSVRDVSPNEATRLLLPVTYKELEMDKSICDYAIAGLLPMAKHLRTAEEVMLSFATKVRHLEINIPEALSISDIQVRILEILEEVK